MSGIRILHLANLASEFYVDYEKERGNPFQSEREFFDHMMLRHQVSLTREVARKDPAFQPALEFTLEANKKAKAEKNVLDVLVKECLHVAGYRDTLSYMPEYTVLLAMYTSFAFQFDEESKKATPRFIALAERVIGWTDMKTFSAATVCALMSALWYGDYRGYRDIFHRCLEDRQKPMIEEQLSQTLQDMGENLRKASINTTTLIFGEVFVEKYVSLRNQGFQLPSLLRGSFVTLTISHMPSLAFQSSGLVSIEFLIKELELFFLAGSERQALEAVEEELPTARLNRDLERQNTEGSQSSPYKPILTFDWIVEYFEEILEPGW